MLQHDLTSIYCSKRGDYKNLQHLIVVQLTYQETKSKCLHVRTCVRLKMVGKWNDASAQKPTTVPNEQTRFLPVLKQYREFQEIKQNRVIFV